MQPEVYDSIKDTFCDIYFNNPDKIEDLMNMLSDSKVKVSDIAKALVTAVQVKDMLDEIQNSNSLIKPYSALNTNK